MNIEFREIYESRHQYALNFGGRGAMGYMCTYVPEELVYASGFLPVRIVGAYESDSVTAPYLFNMFCSYCRDVLSQGLSGRYNYLKGVVHTTCCEKIRNAFDSWGRHVPEQKMYYLFMPQFVQHRGAVATFYQELKRFKVQLETDWEIQISSSDLEKAISVYNENRQLMHRVYELMKEEKPRIMGEELLSISLASQVMDKAEHSSLVRKFLEEIERREGKSVIRTMVIGQTDDLRLAGLLDSMGASVVIDENCFGTRYFWNQVPPLDDMLLAIAARYVERPPCPVKDGDSPRRRPSFILDLARDYRIKLAVMVHPKFCDPHSFDTPVVKNALENRGIKVLELEQDFTIPVAQIRNRLEATLELFQLEIL